MLPACQTSCMKEFLQGEWQSIPRNRILASPSTEAWSLKCPASWSDLVSSGEFFPRRYLHTLLNASDLDEYLPQITKNWFETRIEHVSAPDPIKTSHLIRMGSEPRFLAPEWYQNLLVQPREYEDTYGKFALVEKPLAAYIWINFELEKAALDREASGWKGEDALDSQSVESFSSSDSEPCE